MERRQGGQAVVSKVHLEVTMMKRIGELNAENALLRSEVERLQNNCDYLDQKLDEELDKSAMLCGQVERLTDAITSGNAITPDAHPQP